MNSDLTFKNKSPIRFVHKRTQFIKHFLGHRICHSDNLVDCEVLKDNSLNTSDHNAVKARIKLACLPSMVQGLRPEGRIKWNKTGLADR